MRGLPGPQVSFDLRGIKVEGVRIDVDENGTRAGAHNGTGGSEETKRRGNDRVARLHAAGDQREPKSVGSGSTANGMRDPKVGRYFALERLNFLAKDEMLGGADALHRRQDLL